MVNDLYKISYNDKKTAFSTVLGCRGHGSLPRHGYITAGALISLVYVSMGLQWMAGLASDGENMMIATTVSEGLHESSDHINNEQTDSETTDDGAE